MSMDLEFVSSVLSIGDGFNEYGNLWESIWWRTDGEYAPVTFFVNCNDLFHWATADAEKLTPENLPELRQAVADVRAARGVPTGHFPRLDRDATNEERNKEAADWSCWYDAGGMGADLFCARVRKMRPQRPCYERWPPELHPLFDACGPERDRKEEG